MLKGGPPPAPKRFNRFVFAMFDYITHMYFDFSQHVVFKYVFYYLLALQNHRLFVKGNENNPQTPRILPRRDRTPLF